MADESIEIAAPGPTAGALRAVALEETLLARVRTLAPIAAIAILFIVIATAYNLRVPIYEAPDETAHIGYVDALQRTGRIPDITPNTYEAVGPPLYHGLGAGLLKLLGSAPPWVDLQVNPDRLTEPALFVHTPEDANVFPGQIRSIHLLRALSTLFALGTVLFAYATVRVVLPERPLLAWTVAATAGLVPQFAFVGASVMNDAAVAFFSAATVYFGLRLMRFGELKWAVLSAASLGLGFMTEASLVFVAPIALVAVVLSPLPRRQQLLAAGLLVALPLVFSGWFYIGNLVETGSVYPQEDLGNEGTGILPWDYAYRSVFPAMLQQSYWYMGGHMNLPVFPLVYQFMQLVVGMALAGLIVFGRRVKSVGFSERGIALLGALALVAIFQVVAISVLISFQPQGRYLFIAQPAIALLLALGISSVLQREGQPEHRAVLLLPAVLLALNVEILFNTLPSAY